MTQQQPATGRRQVRIGDAERDAAISTLGNHYAAGRLTKEEFDERSTQASAARFEQDLAPLFADLPGGPSGTVARTSAQTARREARTGGSSRRPHPAMLALALPLMWFAPMAAIALIAVAIIVGAPWLLFLLFWFCVFGGFGRRHRHWQGHRGYAARY
jgi:hypothetical protein